MYWRVRACSRQVAYANALEDMARHMVQGLPWDPLSDIKRQCFSEGKEDDKNGD